MNYHCRDALSYVNQTADANANVFVGDSKTLARTFARSDLNLNTLGARKNSFECYDYIVVSTAQNSDLKFGEFPTVFTVERNGVPLVCVKKPR